MRITYQTRLFLYFVVVFSVFAVAAALFQQHSESVKKRELLLTRLELFSYIAEEAHTSSLFPSNLRVTTIDNNGKVMFDNTVDSLRPLSNHLRRSEIEQARNKGKGYNIRFSNTLKTDYLYFARKVDGGFIRVALPYDNETRMLLRPDARFILFIFILFSVSLIALWFMAKRINSDINHLKENLQREQRERAQMKAEMTNAVAHELRTPVSAIRAYTETLIDAEVPEVRKNQFLQRTYMAAMRLSELLNDVSILTKIEERADSFKREPVGLYDVVNEVIEGSYKQCREKSIRCENLLPQELVYNGNSTLLYSIFSNLINNALHYAGSWIAVRIELTGEDDHAYHFAITDTGVGVPEEHLGRIFERFYRVDIGRSREDGGSGLGLSIVRHAVLFHGGKIHAENGEEGGLKVVFTLAKG